MTPNEFCYWLQGHFELSEAGDRPTERQWEVIRQHLQLVFKKETPEVPKISTRTYPKPPEMPEKRKISEDDSFRRGQHIRVDDLDRMLREINSENRTLTC